jgi:hypothetical protein
LAKSSLLEQLARSHLDKTFDFKEIYLYDGGGYHNYDFLGCDAM